MKIQKFDNTPFGYNKKLNQQLIKKLDKEPNQANFITQTIRELNTFCNRTEDMLEISAQIENDERDYLFDTLVDSKIALANLVEVTYPKLNYTKKEIETYVKEESKNSFTSSTNLYLWKLGLANELAHAINNITSDNENSDNKVDEHYNENQIGEPQVNNNDIIELFTPTKFSPTGFDSLGGMDELKTELYDKIIYPTIHPDKATIDFAEYGKKVPRGIIFYGPPGCGKTTITEALAAESGLPLFKLAISKAGSHYINQTSNNYQKAFDYVAAYAEENKKPCLLFIDEIDGMTKNRDANSSEEDLKQMGTLLNLIETARARNIIVIGATNKYDIVDSAIKRRFDEQVYIGMPDIKTRQQILQKTLNQWVKGKVLAERENDLYEIAEQSSGFPSSALVILADKASDIARKDERRAITKEDFFTEIEKNQNLKINENNYKNNYSSQKIGYKHY